MGARRGGAQREARAAAHVSAWGRRSRGGTGAGTGTGTGTPGPAPRPGQRHRDRDSGTGTSTGPGAPGPAPGLGHRDTGTSTGTGDTGTRSGQGHRHRATGTAAAAAGSSFTPAAPRELNPGRGSSRGVPPTMESPARSCSCGSPASSPGDPSDSEAEASGHPQSPPKAERNRKRPGGPDRTPPELPPSPCGGKRPRKGEGGDTPPSDGDRVFAQKCQELRGFIQPLAELLEGLKRGRYDRGLSSFQQSVAMDRIQRIIGVLQKPEMGARYLGTLLQVEGMLRVWFPHVAHKPAQDPAPASTLLLHRRRPPAGPPGAPRCRRLPGDTPAGTSSSSSSSGTSRRGGRPKCQRPAQTGTPQTPPAPDE